MPPYTSVWKIEKYLSGVSKICVKISNVIVTNHGGSIWISVCTSHLSLNMRWGWTSRHIELMICPFYLFIFQAEERTRYFSVFYLSINAGSSFYICHTHAERLGSFWGPLHKLYSWPARNLFKASYCPSSFIRAWKSECIFLNLELSTKKKDYRLGDGRKEDGYVYDLKNLSL